MKKILLSILIICLSLFLISGFFFIKNTFFDTQEKNWQAEFEKLSHVSYDKKSGNVLVENYRNFDWEKNSEKYEDFTFNIGDIETMEVVISSFSDFDGVAHVFLTFYTQDKQKNITVSVEARREVGEDFSFLGGVLFDYDIIYVIGDEKDLLGLREKREEEVEKISIIAEKEQVQAFLEKIFIDNNILNNAEKKYHLLFNNCANRLTRIVEKHFEKNFSWYEKTLAPGKIKNSLEKNGLIKK